jgi:hypothetical protein
MDALPRKENDERANLLPTNAAYQSQAYQDRGMLRESQAPQ